jgi:hypothetical protein
VVRLLGPDLHKAALRFGFLLRVNLMAMVPPDDLSHGFSIGKTRGETQKIGQARTRRFPAFSGRGFDSPSPPSRAARRTLLRPLAGYLLAEALRHMSEAVNQN